jgi:hypothetical protein
VVEEELRRAEGEREHGRDRHRVRSDVKEPRGRDAGVHALCYVPSVSKRSHNGTNGTARRPAKGSKRARSRATSAQQAARLALLKASGFEFTKDDVEEIRKEMDG